MLRGSRCGAVLAALVATILTAQSVSAACSGTLYLTIDTGHMEPAEEIAKILRKHQVKATFFLANEKTKRGDTSLDPSWKSFWTEMAKAGHAFGSHSYRHWYFRQDLPGGKVAYVSREGKREILTPAQVCKELRGSEEAFRRMTGEAFSPIWRAPGGRTTPNTLKAAKACGFTDHIGWSPAGFLGDELPSDRFPNKMLAEKALKNLRDGDILLLHLGIWSRKDPLWPMLDPILAGLKQRGFCFATIPERLQRQQPMRSSR